MLCLTCSTIKKARCEALGLMHVLSPIQGNSRRLRSASYIAEIPSSLLISRRHRRNEKPTWPRRFSLTKGAKLIGQPAVLAGCVRNIGTTVVKVARRSTERCNGPEGAILLCLNLKLCVQQCWNQAYIYMNGFRPKATFIYLFTYQALTNYLKRS